MQYYYADYFNDDKIVVIETDGIVYYDWILKKYRFKNAIMIKDFNNGKIYHRKLPINVQPLIDKCILLSNPNEILKGIL